MPDFNVIGTFIESATGKAAMTAVVGGVAYWFGLRRDSAKLVYERRSALLSSFVTMAYQGQGLLYAVPFDGEGAGDHKAAMAVLGEELSIYVRKGTVRQVTRITNHFVAAVQARSDMQNEHMRGLPLRAQIDAYLPALRAATYVFRRELGTAGVFERAQLIARQSWKPIGALRTYLFNRRTPTKPGTGL